MKTISAKLTASISELKKNPSALIKESEGEPVAILNNNIPTAYLIPAKTYDNLLEKLEDKDLIRIVRERQHEKQNAIAVSPDEI